MSLEEASKGCLQMFVGDVDDKKMLMEGIFTRALTISQMSLHPTTFAFTFRIP